MFLDNLRVQRVARLELAHVELRADILEAMAQHRQNTLFFQALCEAGQHRGLSLPVAVSLDLGPHLGLRLLDPLDHIV